MQALLKFMYKGSVEVLDSDIQSFMYTANELKIRGLADELLKETIRLVAEKDDDSSDDHPEKKDCIDIENSGHRGGSDVDDVKMTDVRTADITKDQKVECNKNIPREQCEGIKKNIDQPSESQNNGISSKKLETPAVTESPLEAVPVSMLLYVSI
jgi:hypothetical protein